MQTLNLGTIFLNILQSTGLTNITLANIVMLAICFVLIYLAIAKGFEPLLLVPIGFGGLLSNIPMTGITEPGGFYTICILVVSLPVSSPY